jgi:DNA-binding XRE family transcriptional regulator
MNTDSLPFCQLALQVKLPAKRRVRKLLSIASILGDQLKERRAELRLTLREAARQIGITHATMIGWEQLGRKPHARYQFKIGAFLATR